MKITIKELRLIVSEEVQRNMRWSAGMFMAGGVSDGVRDREASLVAPPPGLGDEESQDNEFEEPEEFSQLGAKVARKEVT